MCFGSRCGASVKFFVATFERKSTRRVDFSQHRLWPHSETKTLRRIVANLVARDPAAARSF